MPNILWFSEVSNEDIDNCGNKGSFLGEMYNIGLPIPQGFVITEESYKKFLQENRIDKQIENILSIINLNDPKQIQLKSEEIQEIIMKNDFPQDIKEEILENYENLNVDKEIIKFGNKSALNLVKMGRNLPYVAVRSSIMEIPEMKIDLPTFLSVKGNSSLFLNIKKCWASLFDAKSIYFREKNNIDYNKLNIAVIIQRMINSESSGLISNGNEEIFIEAAYGFSEIVLSKLTNFNKYKIDKESLNIKNKNIMKQDYMVVREESLNKNVKRQVLENKPQQVLTDEQILQLSQYAKKIDQYYKRPVNIEFAFESGKSYILNIKENI